MKVKILAKTAVISTEFSKESIETVTKFNPDLLKLKDDKGQDVFGICTGKTGSVSKNGICFDGVDGEGKAYVSVTIPDSVAADKRGDYITDNFGHAMANLMTLEATKEAVAESYATFRASVTGAISVLD